MKLLLQRVKRASVTVDDREAGAIGHGLLVFAGIQRSDTDDTVTRMVDRLLHYRLFADDQDRMNLDITQVSGAGLLLVSQFTLAADTAKGRRPNFSSAMAPDLASQLFDSFVDQVRAGFSGPVQTGEFGADMQVALVNDGPVTFLLE